MFLTRQKYQDLFPRPFKGGLAQRRASLLNARAAPKAREILRDLLPQPVGQGRRATITLVGCGGGEGMPAKRSHLEERARDPARTAGPRVKGGRWLALAAKEEKSRALSGGRPLAGPACVC